MRCYNWLSRHRHRFVTLGAGPSLWPLFLSNIHLSIPLSLQNFKLADIGESITENGVIKYGSLVLLTRTELIIIIISSNRGVGSSWSSLWSPIRQSQYQSIWWYHRRTGWTSLSNINVNICMISCKWINNKELNLNTKRRSHELLHPWQTLKPLVCATKSYTRISVPSPPWVSSIASHLVPIWFYPQSERSLSSPHPRPLTSPPASSLHRSKTTYSPTIYPRINPTQHRMACIDRRRGRGPGSQYGWMSHSVTIW